MSQSRIREWSAERLPALRREYDVPGCAVGVLTGDGIETAADGVLHLGTGAPATPDALFQIGSVTKVWTATLVLQAVESGLLRLDVPVAAVLPGFRVADREASETITVRHLLTHTSGIFGDSFAGTSRGDDAVARYVDETVPTLPQDLPPGTGMSYANAGFVILGRIAEVLYGRPYHQLLADDIAGPLGLEHWAAIPEQALLHATALGHVTPPGGTPRPAPVWAVPAATGPSGAMLAMSPRALLTFADDLMTGHTLLSAETLALALTPQVAVPDIGALGSHWGLGWMLFDGPSPRLVGHDGGTVGQSCVFRMLPDAGIALVSMANGGRAAGYHQAVARDLLRELAGVELPPEAVPPAHPEPVDAARYAGRYDSSALSFEVKVRADGSAVAVQSALTPELKAVQPEDVAIELVALDDGRLVATDAPMGRHQVVAFLGGGPGVPATHVFRSGRLTPRTS